MSVGWYFLLVAAGLELLLPFLLAPFYPGYSHRRQVMSVLGSPVRTGERFPKAAHRSGVAAHRSSPSATSHTRYTHRTGLSGLPSTLMTCRRWE